MSATSCNANCQVSEFWGVWNASKISTMRSMWWWRRQGSPPASRSRWVRRSASENLSSRRENGFDGYAGTDPFHALKSYDEVSRALVSLAIHPLTGSSFSKRIQRPRRFLARRSNADGLTSFTGAVRTLSRLIVLITDQPIWGIGTAQQERLAQWLRQFSTSARRRALWRERETTMSPSERRGSRLGRSMPSDKRIGYAENA